MQGILVVFPCTQPQAFGLATIKLGARCLLVLRINVKGGSDGSVGGDGN
jgi:hypothetical protein